MSLKLVWPFSGTFKRIANGSPAAARASDSSCDKLRNGVLLFRREVAIRLAFCEETLSRGAMFRRIRRLENKLFVVIESEPGETFDDRARRLFSRTLQVRVLDA